MALHHPSSSSTGYIDNDNTVAHGSGSELSPISPLLQRRSFERFPVQYPHSGEGASSASSDVVTSRQAYTLYLCHFLSTWQSRVYEFAAVIFTASAFPQNLLASSIFGMIMSLSILCFASLLGTWIDRSPSRLKTLCSTIVANRVSVIASCLCWILIVGDTANGDADKDHSTQPPEAFWLIIKKTTFVFIIVFGVIERLSRTANLLSIERDWIPTLAPSTGTEEKFGLAQLNAVMSRIDLVCKLVGPILISSFVSAVGSMRVVAFTLLVLNVATFAPEISTARMVWNSSSRLKAPKKTDSGQTLSSATVSVLTDSAVNNRQPLWRRLASSIYLLSGIRYVMIWLQDYRDNLKIYFAYRVWVPSLALSVLHFSVLNYSATLTVYLLSSGFSINIITMARAFSSIWEIGSTFFYPWGVRLCNTSYDKTSQLNYEGIVQEEGIEEILEVEGREQEVGEEQKIVFKADVDLGVAVLGIVGLAQMWICLIPAAFAIWTLSAPRESSVSPVTHPMFITVLLLSTIPFSRFGRWINHLSTQQLTQTLVPPSHRSGFAGAEMALVNLFQMGHWVVTAIWSTHEDFRWLALGSVVSVGVSWMMYLWWWRREVRGNRETRL